MNKSTWLFLLILTFNGCAAPPGAPPTRAVSTTVEIDAPPEVVLRAFLDPDDLESWWKVSRSLVQEEPGGVWSVTWDAYGPERTQHVWTGVVEEIGDRHLKIGHLVLVEPSRPLFGPLEIEVIASPRDGRTSLTVLHKGYRYGRDWDWIHDVVVEGWQHVLADLQEWMRRRGAGDDAPAG